MNAAAYPQKGLPDDVEALKQIIADQQTILVKKDKRIQLLEEFVQLQKLKKFAASSEKSADQREMFNEAELTVEAEAALQAEDKEFRQSLPKSACPRQKPCRKPLPPELPRVRVEHELPASEKQCPCGHERVEMGEATSEQLDIIPAQVRVLVHARKKYACRHCEEGVKTASLPAQPIPKSNASAGLLAHIAVAKFQDALPLHRQQAVLARSGVELPRNTLASWMIKSGKLVQPLINLLDDQLVSYPVMHCDETTVQVLKEPDKNATSHSYMWVRVGGPPTRPIRLFHYAAGRGGGIASSLLSGYQGYLQTDDYGGYNSIGAEKGITHLGCWAAGRMRGANSSRPRRPVPRARRPARPMLQSA